MWKSKIGLLEQILARIPYVTFFLGHPVVRKAETIYWTPGIFGSDKNNNSQLYSMFRCFMTLIRHGENTEKVHTSITLDSLGSA